MINLLRTIYFQKRGNVLILFYSVKTRVFGPLLDMVNKKLTNRLL
jgi:hypothetical protein